MTAKRVTRRPRAEPKTSPATELTQEAVASILESNPSSAARAALDAETRRQLIATEAYFLAERRGFAAGHEFEDWLEAEMTVEARLRSLRAA